MKGNPRMNYAEFKSYVANNIHHYLPKELSGVKVEVQAVRRNNDCRQDTLQIKQAGCRAVPTLYLADYFRSYDHGRDPELIMKDIVSRRMEWEQEYHDNLEGDIQDIIEGCHFEDVRDRILPRLINYRWNESHLQSIPHTRIADLAVTYYYYFGTGDNSYMAEVTAPWIRHFEVTAEELHAQAIRNMELHLPLSLDSLDRFVADFLKKNLTDEREIEDFGFETDPNGKVLESRRLILTNQLRRFGAAAVLSRKNMEEVRKRIGDDIVMIPSSVHEMILCPRDCDLSLKELEDMLQHVNATEVLQEEQLSDRIYTYDFEKGELQGL